MRNPNCIRVCKFQSKTYSREGYEADSLLLNTPAQLTVTNLQVTVGKLTACGGGGNIKLTACTLYLATCEQPPPNEPGVHPPNILAHHDRLEGG